MTTYYCVMMNNEGLTFTHYPSDVDGEQPYDTATREVAEMEYHKKYGPWRVIRTDRNT